MYISQFQESLSDGFDPFIGGKYGFMLFFELPFDKKLLLLTPRALLLLFSVKSLLQGEYCRRLTVELQIFYLGLDWIRKCFFPSLTGFSKIADLQLATFFSNRGSCFISFAPFVSSFSSSPSEADKLTESSVFHD